MGSILEVQKHMNARRVIVLVFLLCMIAAFPTAEALLAAPSSSPLVALVNSSGQLIVSSADGNYRWIVTNPGQTLAGAFAWASDGNQIMFAVGNSLNSGSIAQQNVSQIGQAAGSVISLSPDGKYLFYQASSGAYGLQAVNGGSGTPLSLSNDQNARYSGLWSNAAPLVAYWGYSGNSVLAVTDASSAQTLTFDSGLSAPITPLAWLPKSTRLIFRDASGVVRLADVGCLSSNCGANPLQNAAALASADADIATDGTSLYFRSGSNISALNLGCVEGGTCDSGAVVIAQNAAPQTAINVAGGTLIYTSFSANSADPHDRAVDTLALSCASNPSSCAPQQIVTQAVAGAVSSDGHYAVVDTPNGLQILDLSSGATTYLADEGANLASAVWQS